MVPVKDSQACDKKYITAAAFESITSEYSLYCDQAHLKELLQAVILFSSSVISSLVMVFQNKFGSKVTFLLSFGFITLPGLICTVLVPGLAVKVVGIILLWAYTDILLTLGPVYANELLVEPYRSLSNGVFRFMHGLGGAFGTWMTLHLRDYRLIVCLYCAGYLVNNLMLAFALPQSPSYLLKQQKIDKLRQTITRIACVSQFPEEQLEAALVNLDRIIESNRPASP